jgi:RNA polymerase sigma-70 factor (ECF subfamily)
MFYLEQMSLSEIAEALSLPLGTVKSRLHYAKQELKAALERKIE